MRMSEFMDLFQGKDLEALSKTKLAIDGVGYTQNQFVKHFFDEVMDGVKSPRLDELMVLYVQDQAKFKSKALRIYGSLMQTVSKPQEVETPEGILPVENLEIVTEIRSGNEYVIDTVKNELTMISPKAYYKCFPGGKGSAREAEQNCPKQVVQIEFNPMRSEALYERDGRTCLNKYRPPAWRSQESTQEPTVYLELLDHLFNRDQVQIDFVKDWQYRLLTSKNETILVLNGDKGVGKNALYEVNQALVGREYCSQATKKFGKKEFNAELRDKILILIDEHRIDADKHQYLKAATNRWQTIEAKGQDVKATEEIFVNFTIHHNNARDMYLEDDHDRRFSVMDITNTRLDTAWGEEKLQKFFKDLEDPNSKLVASIGHYLLAWGEDREQNPFAIYKGKRFEEILTSHHPFMIQAVISLIEEKVLEGLEEDEPMVLTSKKINTRVQRYNPGKSYSSVKGTTAADLIRKYKYEGRISLGHVKTKAPWSLTVNQELISYLVNNTDKIKENL